MTTISTQATSRSGPDVGECNRYEFNSHFLTSLCDRVAQRVAVGVVERVAIEERFRTVENVGRTWAWI